MHRIVFVFFCEMILASSAQAQVGCDTDVEEAFHQGAAAGVARQVEIRRIDRNSRIRNLTCLSQIMRVYRNAKNEIGGSVAGWLGVGDRFSSVIDRQIDTILQQSASRGCQQVNDSVPNVPRRIPGAGLVRNPSLNLTNPLGVTGTRSFPSSVRTPSGTVPNSVGQQGNQQNVGNEEALEKLLETLILGGRT